MSKDRDTAIDQLGIADRLVKTTTEQIMVSLSAACTYAVLDAAAAVREAVTALRGTSVPGPREP